MLGYGSYAVSFHQWCTVCMCQEISVILKGEFVLVLSNDNTRATFVHLVSYRVVESFKDAFGIVFPYLCRNQRVLWVNLEAIVSDSVEQFTCCANKWDGVDISKRLSVLKALPYNLSHVLEFVGFLFFANKQQCCSCYLTVNSQASSIKEDFVTPCVTVMSIQGDNALCNPHEQVLLLSCQGLL